MKNNAVLTNPLRRKRFEVGDRYLIHVAQDGEEYAVHHTTLDPATWVIVTSITDTAVTDQHPIESRWLNSESRWLNSRGVDDFIPYPLRNVFTAGDWRSAVAIDPSPCCCVRLGRRGRGGSSRTFLHSGRSIIAADLNAVLVYCPPHLPFGEAFPFLDVSGRGRPAVEFFERLVDEFDGRHNEQHTQPQRTKARRNRACDQRFAAATRSGRQRAFG
jgi:hypothetical protein